MGTLAQEPGAGKATGAPDSNRVKANVIVARMLEKNSERTAALEHHTSGRAYLVEYMGTGGECYAEVKVHAECKSFEHKQLTVVAESGLKFICDKVLRKLVEGRQEASNRSNRKQISLAPESYDAVLVGEEIPE